MNECKNCVWAYLHGGKVEYCAMHDKDEPVVSCDQFEEDDFKNEVEE